MDITFQIEVLLLDALLDHRRFLNTRHRIPFKSKMTFNHHGTFVDSTTSRKSAFWNYTYDFVLSCFGHKQLWQVCMSKSLWTSHLGHLQSYRTTNSNYYLEVHQWFLVMWPLMWEMLLNHEHSQRPTWRLPTYLAIPTKVTGRIYNYHCH
jgi:hypothetical protein